MGIIAEHTSKGKKEFEKAIRDSPSELIREGETCATGKRLYQTLNVGGYKQGEKCLHFQSLTRTARRAMNRRGCIRYSRQGTFVRAAHLQVVDAAVSAGWFKEVRGKPGGKHLSRLVPTWRLVEELDKSPPEVNKMPVVLKEPKGRRLPFDHNHPVARRVARRLTRVNTVNRRYVIKGHIADEWGKVRVRRVWGEHTAVFHDEFQLHGRMYGLHTEMSELERTTITFDDMPGVELDYSGCMPRMLYHEEGIDYRDDPYQLWGEQTTGDQREVVKKIMVKLFNCQTSTQLERSLRDMPVVRMSKTGKEIKHARLTKRVLKKLGMTVFELAERVAEFHSPIGRYIKSGIGKEMMTIDARIALAVLTHFARQSIPCLSIHDSFIVPLPFVEELNQVMKRKYKHVFNYLPVIECKYLPSPPSSHFNILD